MRRILPAFLLLLCLLFSDPSLAATRTWAGGTHNWSATAAWVEGVVPTAADDVVMNVNTTGALTVDGTSGSPSLCRSLDATGFTGTITMGGTAVLAVGDSGGGSFKMVSGATFSLNAGATINFVSTTTGNQITTGGKSMPIVVFNGVGGAWQLQDTYTAVSTDSITLTNGSLDTNGKSVTAQFSSSNGNTRSLTLGATTWNIDLGSGSTNWDITNSSGMTLSSASSTITSTSFTSQSNTFSGGGLAYGALTATGKTTATFTIKGADSFTALTMSCGAGVTCTYLIDANESVSGTLTMIGNTPNNRDFVRSTVKGTQRTITAATVVASYLDLQDIVGAGGGNWNLSAITGNSGDCGNNSGVTFTAGQSDFWTGHTGSWSTNTNWKTTSGGGTTARTPLCQDTSVFDSNSFNAGSETVTFDNSASPRTGAINFANVTNNPAFQISQAFSFYGSVTFKSGMTTTSANIITYEGRKNSSFTTGGVSILQGLTVDATATNTLSLADNFTSVRGSNTGLVATSGIIDATASTVALNSGTGFQLNGGTIKFGPGGATFTANIGLGTTGGTLTSNGKLTLTYTSNTAGSISVTAPPPVINPGMHGGFN